jgi:predicted lysophospholipase L1 biosynthesis ABC-type transport system permease subunit
MNPSLALLLAWRRLTQQRLQSVVTVLGVALGLTVAAAIVIVDHNSSERRIASQSLLDLSKAAPNRSGSDQDRSGQARTIAPRRILKLSFERQGEARASADRKTSAQAPAVQRPSQHAAGPLPSQEGLGAGGLSADRPLPRRGEEDYQAMRLAVRLASLMAFAVGAVIVFYSMRFSVISRGRELMLLLCLGQERKGLGLSLAMEAALLGIAGTLLGLIAGWWTGLGLLDAGVSTTGRVPSQHPRLPWGELAMLGCLSLSIALLGVLGPLRRLLRMQPVDVLQPRFLSQQDAAGGLTAAGLRGFGWLVPVLMLASWLAVRPILQDWLSVIQFFLVEATVAAATGLAILWWMGPVLRGAVQLMEWSLRPLLPLEALLAGRRLRAIGKELVFTVASVTLVFSLVIGLDGLTRSLKAEIAAWGDSAWTPMCFSTIGRGPRCWQTRCSIRRAPRGCFRCAYRARSAVRSPSG